MCTAPGARAGWGNCLPVSPRWKRRRALRPAGWLCASTTSSPGSGFLNFTWPSSVSSRESLKFQEMREGGSPGDRWVSFLPCFSVPGEAAWSQSCGLQDPGGLALFRDLGPKLDLSSLLMRGQQPPMELETLFPPCSLTFAWAGKHHPHLPLQQGRGRCSDQALSLRCLGLLSRFISSSIFGLASVLQGPWSCRNATGRKVSGPELSGGSHTKYRTLSLVIKEEAGQVALGNWSILRDFSITTASLSLAWLPRRQLLGCF